MEHRGNKLAIVMGTEPKGEVEEASGAMGMQQAQACLGAAMTNVLQPKLRGRGRRSGLAGWSRSRN